MEEAERAIAAERENAGCVISGGYRVKGKSRKIKKHQKTLRRRKSIKKKNIK